jgi:hypothetical protein
MFRTLRLSFFAVAIAGLLALGGGALAHGIGQVDTWGLARFLLREVRRSEALDAREEASRRYSQAKHAVTDEVIAGRLSLAEAAERFAQLGELLDGNDTDIGKYIQPDGEQALCRNVILWVSVTLGRGSGEQKAVLARLEAEYRQRFGAASLSAASADLSAPAKAHRGARPHRMLARRAGRPRGLPAPGM